MRAPSDKFIRRLIWILLALAIFFVGAAFYIPARAMLSQTLLEQPRSGTLNGSSNAGKPDIISAVTNVQQNTPSQDT